MPQAAESRMVDGIKFTSEKIKWSACGGQDKCVLSEGKCLYTGQLLGGHHFAHHCRTDEPLVPSCCRSASRQALRDAQQGAGEETQACKHQQASGNLPAASPLDHCATWSPDATTKLLLNRQFSTPSCTVGHREQAGTCKRSKADTCENRRRFDCAWARALQPPLRTHQQTMSQQGHVRLGLKLQIPE